MILKVPMLKLNNRVLAGFLTLSALAAIATPGLSTKAVAQPATGRNIVFISVGDLRNWLGFNGNYDGTVHTPNIDALAAQSTIFVNAYTTVPQCIGARTSVMYGLSPATHGATSTGYTNPEYDAIHADPTLQSLPEVMSANNYYSAVTGDMFHGLFPDKWDEQGPAPYPDTAIDMGPEGTYFNPSVLPPGEIHADQVRADWAVGFMEAYSDPEPCFLGRDFILPHVPWDVPQWAYDLYAVEDIVTSTPVPGDLDDEPTKAVQLANEPYMPISTLTQYEAVEAADKAHDYTHAYLAAISHTDAMIGVVLDALAAGAHANNTDIILWSDHGFHLGEKFHWRKSTLWQESVNVPLIIKSPSNPNYPIGDVVRSVSTLDLAPTVLDLAGLPAFAQFEGLPLYNTLKRHPKVYLNDAKATITGPWKFIDYDVTSSDPDDEAAYKLLDDPDELVNEIVEYRLPPGC
jgi:arylsulfatase A-like enzyme